MNEEEARGLRRERVLTQWESEHGPVSLKLDSIYRDGWVCTAYALGSLYDGSEGELYDLNEDPVARVNRWSDPQRQSIKSDLLADLSDSLPAPRRPRLPRKAPV